MDNEFIRRTTRDALILFLAATALAVVYNSASPLGVRWRAGSAESAAPTPTGRANDSNETLAITSRTQRTAPSANPRVQNETLSVSVQPTTLALPNTTPAQKNIPSMTWPQVKTMGNAIVIVDARDPTAFDAGHVPNAISLPTRLLRENIDTFTAEVPRNKPIAIYCANAKCTLSRNLAQALVEQYGYLDVRDVPGGYAEWLLNQPAK